MIIANLSYLEDVVEAPSIVGGQQSSRPSYFEDCYYQPYYDESGNLDSYYSYYECYGRLKKRPTPPTSGDSSGSSF